MITHIRAGLTLSSICNTLTAIKPVLIYTYPHTTTCTTATRKQVQKFEYFVTNNSCYNASAHYVSITANSSRFFNPLSHINMPFRPVLLSKPNYTWLLHVSKVIQSHFDRHIIKEKTSIYNVYNFESTLYGPFNYNVYLYAKWAHSTL